MIPYQTYPIARYRMGESLAHAERRRISRGARSGAIGAHGTGVIDALGHGLIFIGSRLVADRQDHPTAHPPSKRAA
ncbi:MAG: hypothetical protein WB239_02915 [Acidimicrobiia bacterium]